MIIKTNVAVLGFVFSALLSSSAYAHLPLSYNDVVQAERERMQAHNPRSTDDSPAVREPDEQWLLKTPGTWGYLINKERLRMKQSLPQTNVQPATSAQKPNLMPTTLNEGVRLQHQQMENTQKSKQ